MNPESFCVEIDQILGETPVFVVLYGFTNLGNATKKFRLQSDRVVPKAGFGRTGRIETFDREVGSIRKLSAGLFYLG